MVSQEPIEPNTRTDNRETNKRSGWEQWHHWRRAGVEPPPWKAKCKNRDPT